LQAAQEQQQQWGGDTDRLVGRQQADGQRRGGHQQDDDGQHPLPRDPVAQRSEHEPAEWSHEERRREDRESVQQSRGFISRRKETGGDERCEEAVDGKVEPLDGVADRSSGHSLTHIRCPAAALAPAGWHGDSPESKRPA